MCDSPRTGCAWWTTPMWREQAETKWSQRGIFTVACCNSGKLCALAARRFQSQQSGALTRMWRWCQVQPSQIECAIGAVHCKNEGMLLEPFSWRCIESVVFIYTAQYMKMTRHEHVFVFKSCDISIHWWIWMLSFLLKQSLIGIDYFFWTSSQLLLQFGDCRLP